MSLNKRDEKRGCFFKYKSDVMDNEYSRIKMFSYESKTILIILSVYFLSSCSSKSASDCFQSTGNVFRKEISVSNFSKITVFENVSLVLKHGDIQKVEIETGEFLRNEITAIVEGDRLELKDRNDCNFFRDYGTTKVYVTSPNITEIRSSTGLTIESDGVLSYSSLSLVTESFTNTGSRTTDGFIDLEFVGQNLSILSNGIAYYKLRGNTKNLNVFIASSDSRIEADNLMAEFVTINHRGTNDIVINPQQSLSGVIRGIGDVVSLNRPDVIDVEELFKGRLIFR